MAVTPTAARLAETRQPSPCRELRGREWLRRLSRATLKRNFVRSNSREVTTSRFYSWALFIGALFATYEDALAQVCRPVAGRTTELGCWIIAAEPVGNLSKP